MQPVTISVTLNVDVQGWADEYGIDPSDVEADVKRWASERLHRYDDSLAVVVGSR